MFEIFAKTKWNKLIQKQIQIFENQQGIFMII